MASEDSRRAPPQRMDNGGAAHRILFPDDALRFPGGGGGGGRGGRGVDHSAQNPRPAAIFSDGRDGRFPFYNPQSHNWNTDGDTGSDDDEDDDGEDELDEGDGEVEGLVRVGGKHGNNSSGSVQSSSDGDPQGHHLLGLNRGVAVKANEQQHHLDQIGGYENAITVVEPGPYCPQIVHRDDEPVLARKDAGGENSYGFGPGESLRTHLSDPITGLLMDDAMILPCGHSFGSGGMQHIYRMKACHKCSQSISEDLVRPNLSLRSAVQAFRREEESQSMRASKRRRDRSEQEKCGYDDPFSMDSRGKGVQFPFVVSDRVMIKGNKRTPQRFVGRVAVVTTQCLNGWYVVKTLDNAESVKLQYRSLAKVPEDSSNLTTKPISPSWL